MVAAMRDGGKHDQSLDREAIAGGVVCAAASPSLDHLVGAGEQRRRNRRARGLRCERRRRTTKGDDHGHLAAKEIGRQLRQTFRNVPQRRDIRSRH